MVAAGVFVSYSLGTMAMGLDDLFEREVRHDGIALCLASLRTYYTAATDPEPVAVSESEVVLDADPEAAATQAPATDLEVRTDLEAPTVGAADLLEAWRARVLAVSPRSPPHETLDAKPASLEAAAAVAAEAAAAVAAAAEAGAAEAASGTSEPRSWSGLNEMRAQLDEMRAQLASERVRSELMLASERVRSELMLASERVLRRQCEAELAALRRSSDEALDRQRNVAERGIRELQGEVARLQERAAVKERAAAVEERAHTATLACEVDKSRQSPQSAPRTASSGGAGEHSSRMATALVPPIQTSRSSTDGLPLYDSRDSTSSPRRGTDTCDGQDPRGCVGLGLPRLFVYANWVAIYAAAIYAILAWLSVAPQAGS